MAQVHHSYSFCDVCVLVWSFLKTLCCRRFRSKSADVHCSFWILYAKYQEQTRIPRTNKQTNNCRLHRRRPAAITPCTMRRRPLRVAPTNSTRTRTAPHRSRTIAAAAEVAARRPPAAAARRSAAARPARAATRTTPIARRPPAPVRAATATRRPLPVACRTAPHTVTIRTVFRSQKHTHTHTREPTHIRPNSIRDATAFYCSRSFLNIYLYAYV